MIPGKERLIVALDTETHEEAIEIVEELSLGNVRHFKVGLGLLLKGNLIELLEAITRKTKRKNGSIFLDLKLSGDIENTIELLMKQCIELRVNWLSLVECACFHTTLQTVKAARKVREKAGFEHPKLLMVPVLSSTNLKYMNARSGIMGGVKVDGVEQVSEYLIHNGQKWLTNGCDGLVVSGNNIELARENFPSATLVCPGIRPSWMDEDEHGQAARTPHNAVRLGADYLVVGRPITQSNDPRKTAQDVIDEIDTSLMREKEKQNDVRRSDDGESKADEDTPQLHP